jgi:hypothetical protein
MRRLDGGSEHRGQNISTKHTPDTGPVVLYILTPEVPPSCLI